MESIPTLITFTSNLKNTLWLIILGVLEETFILFFISSYFISYSIRTLIYSGHLVLLKMNSKSNSFLSFFSGKFLRLPDYFLGGSFLDFSNVLFSCYSLTSKVSLWYTNIYAFASEPSPPYPSFNTSPIGTS